MAGSETVLLVEDDEQILELAETILEEHGYTVLASQTAEDACLICEKYPGDIHLLVTDVVMPKMNGRELQERISGLRPGIRTLYMSGYTADIIARRGVIDEGINFIGKPFSLQSLVEKVREVLNE